jgi:hypothetical protein
MTLLIYFLLFIAIVIAWCGARLPAFYCYMATILIAAIVFIHHLTTPLTLQL